MARAGRLFAFARAGFDFFDLNVGAANRVTHSLLAILDFLGDRHLSDHAGLDPTTIAEHVSYLGGLLPNAGLEIIEQQLKALVSRDAEALGVGFLVGLAIALWSANNGIKAVFDAMNVAYEEVEKRSFVRLNLLSAMFTIGAIIIASVMLLAVGIVPAMLALLHLEGWTEVLIAIGRWPLLLASIWFGISADFKWILPGLSNAGPGDLSRTATARAATTPNWRWLNWGFRLRRQPSSGCPPPGSMWALLIKQSHISSIDALACGTVSCARRLFIFPSARILPTTMPLYASLAVHRLS